jgi:hypothetical protein
MIDNGSDIHQGGDGPLMSSALWLPNTDDELVSELDAEPSLLHACLAAYNSECLLGVRFALESRRVAESKWSPL